MRFATNRIPNLFQGTRKRPKVFRPGDTDQKLSVATPADSRCEKKLEIAIDILFDTAGAKL